MKRFSMHSFPLQNKTVLLRVDFNEPIEHKKVLDTAKIKAALSTIKFLLNQKCKVILMTHIGRPQGKVNPSLSTKIILPEVERLLKNKIEWIHDCIGKEVKDKIQKTRKKVILLENLRFYHEEEQNDPAFAHSLSELAEVYVNDAFGVCHRKHASVHAITQFLPSLAGMLIEREITHLSQALLPKHPCVWVMGGAKLKKVALIEKALETADKVLIAGALPFSFFRARNIPVGQSKVDTESIANAKKILKHKQAHKLVLPIDFVTTSQFSARGNTKITQHNNIKSNEMGLDIGPQTIASFKHHLSKAKTIVWNGPLGYFEWASFAAGTRDIGRFIASSNATTICGGGETIEAIHKFRLTSKLTHVSTGGGASLSFLTGKRLPAISALENNYKRFHRKINM